MAEERERMPIFIEQNSSPFQRDAVYEAAVLKLSNQVCKISVSGIEGSIKKLN